MVWDNWLGGACDLDLLVESSSEGIDFGITGRHLSISTSSIFEMGVGPLGGTAFEVQSLVRADPDLRNAPLHLEIIVVLWNPQESPCELGGACDLDLLVESSSEGVDFG